jgi:mannose-6-phosphate isomerase-like protein (cupin superfamily)
MLIKSQEATVKFMPGCTVHEFPFPSTNLGIAQVNMTGRYPETGKAMNTVCDMIYYITSGTGIIHTEKGIFEVKKGDSYFFDKNTWYWIEANNLEVCLTTAPNWYFEQYKILE